MTRKNSNASTGPTLSDAFDKLIVELTLASKLLDSKDRSGLVNLNNALRRAKRMRKQFGSIKKGSDRSETTEAILFIISVIKGIYSLINCLLSQNNYEKHWVYNKNIAYC